MVDQTMPTPTNKPVSAKAPAGQRKWLLWSLIGFTGILLITAVVLFFQISRPATAPLPSSRPKASPEIPTVEEATTEAENACQLGFTVAEIPPAVCYEACNTTADCNSGLACQTVSGTKRCVNATCPSESDCTCAVASTLECTEVTMSPTGSSIRANDTRQLTAAVTGGSGTYTHSWEITSAGTGKGSLSSTTSNPTTWTAPSSLSSSQTWTIKDTVKDTSSPTQQTDTCEVDLDFSGLVACFDTCSADSDCSTNLKCQTVGGTKRCVNQSCSEDADCSCAGAAASPTPPATPTPPLAQDSPSPSTIARVEQPELPVAGVSAPAILGVSAGILLMLLGLLF